VTLSHRHLRCLLFEWRGDARWAELVAVQAETVLERGLLGALFCALLEDGPRAPPQRLYALCTDLYARAAPAQQRLLASYAYARACARPDHPPPFASLWSPEQVRASAGPLRLLPHEVGC
jgi:hypothetical protein